MYYSFLDGNSKQSNAGGGDIATFGNESSNHPIIQEKKQVRNVSSENNLKLNKNKNTSKLEDNAEN